MPMIAQVCHHPCCSQVKKKLWVSHVGAYGDALAPLSPPILFSVGKKLWRFAWRPRRARGQ
jgi:hypothetical protein